MASGGTNAWDTAATSTAFVFYDETGAGTAFTISGLSQVSALSLTGASTVNATINNANVAFGSLSNGVFTVSQDSFSKAVGDLTEGASLSLVDAYDKDNILYSLSLGANMPRCQQHARH